ncbi:hypothetical protein GCM10010437_055580 [Actinoplanes palleronii]
MQVNAVNDMTPTKPNPHTGRPYPETPARVRFHAKPAHPQPPARARVRRKSQKKTGPPTIAVSTPSGNS